MIGSTLITGIVAGIAAAILFSAAGAGSMLSLALFYVATLPLFIVGLGWGWSASVAAIIAGCTTISLISGPTAGFMFLLAFALPSGWLCYLALLYRDADQNDPENPEERDWYPIGMIICWVAALGAALTISSIFFFGGSLEGYKAFIHDAFGPVFLAMENSGTSQPVDQDAIDSFIDLLVRLLPIMLVSSWMTVTFANLYGGGKIAILSSRLVRPWPDLHNIELPARFALVPIFAFAISFLGGWPGLAGTVALTAAIGAYAIQGLSVAHHISRGFAARPFILTLIYGSLVMLAFPALILAGVGLAEPTLKLRARAQISRSKMPPS